MPFYLFDSNAFKVKTLIILKRMHLLITYLLFGWFDLSIRYTQKVI